MFKIILHYRDSGFVETISFILPNVPKKIEDIPKHLENHIASIDDIEAVTGIRFLPTLANVDPDKEVVVSAYKAPTLWVVDSLTNALHGNCKSTYPEW